MSHGPPATPTKPVLHVQSAISADNADDELCAGQSWHNENILHLTYVLKPEFDCHASFSGSDMSP